MCLKSRSSRSRRNRGFTLMEVLMVIAVIGILLAIIVPAIGGAQTSARRAKTRVQFSQWGAAIEQFRQEYGYYPNWGDDNSNDSFASGLIATAQQTQRFLQCLSGRKIDGSPYTSTDPGYRAGNTKRLQFCSFGGDDLTSGAAPQLQDAFGNTEIVVLMDRDLNGVILFAGTSRDYDGLPPNVRPNGSTTSLNPITSTAVSLRTGVAFYSAGDGQRPVTSW